MIEATIMISGAIEIALILTIWFRLNRVEAHLDRLTEEASRMKKTDDLQLGQIVDTIKEEMLDVVSNMRPPTAIDHLAGMWGQIMMMREQVKMAKEGILPQPVAPRGENWETIDS
jgi:hypothetical protein